MSKSNKLAYIYFRNLTLYSMLSPVVVVVCMIVYTEYNPTPSPFHQYIPFLPLFLIVPLTVLFFIKESGLSKGVLVFSQAIVLVVYGFLAISAFSGAFVFFMFICLIGLMLIVNKATENELLDELYSKVAIVATVVQAIVFILFKAVRVHIFQLRLFLLASPLPAG